MRTPPTPIRLNTRTLALALVVCVMLAPLACGGQPASADAPGAFELVVPFPPGGGAEFAARQLADALRRTGGPAVNVTHHTGEDGVTGADYVAKAEPDGRTLLLGSKASLTYGPLARGRPAFDPVVEFEPIAVLASIPRLILVHPSVRATTIDALIRLVRANPGSIPCGTSDAVAEHASRTFERMTGVSLHCTAYPGVAPTLRQDLLAGRIKLAFESALLTDVQAGSLRALAVAGAAPVRALPGVPTASEAGLPGFDASVWVGVFAPPKTSPEIAKRLSESIARAMEDPAALAAFQGRGYLVRVVTGLPMRTFLESEQRAQPRALPGGARPRDAAPN